MYIYIYISVASLSSCVAQAVLKKYGEEYNGARRKISHGRQPNKLKKPIFPRSIARLSHSKVHEPEKVLYAAIEAVEVQTMKTR
jgi:hypothetical protein